MKKILTLAAAFALFATSQAFAIIGVGAHYVMNTGSLKSSEGSAYDFQPAELGSINVIQESADGLQGIGFKLWVDLLPFIDVEGTFNIAATRYKTSLVFPGQDSIKLSYTPDAPYNMIFGDADPLFGVVNGDLSVTKPFTSLPIIRPYIGAGISYFASIPLVNHNFARKMFDNIPFDGPIDETLAQEMGKALAKTLKDESYTTGMGGHLILGVRFKLPIIPIAAYTNGKYYFGGNTNSQFSQGLVLELGGGFAL